MIPGVTENTEVTPILYFDNESVTSVGNVINKTTYPNEDKSIELTSKNFNNSTHGEYNFFLEFQITGSDLAVIGLPINIELEINE